MNALSLLELARYHARPRERAPIGTPDASIEVLTARGKRVLTTSTKRARSGDTPGRLDHQERTDDRHE